MSITLCKLSWIKTQEYSFFLLAGDVSEQLDKCNTHLSQQRKQLSKNLARYSHKNLVTNGQIDINLKNKNRSISSFNSKLITTRKHSQWNLIISMKWKSRNQLLTSLSSISLRIFQVLKYSNKLIDNLQFLNTIYLWLSCPKQLWLKLKES